MHNDFKIGKPLIARIKVIGFLKAPVRESSFALFHFPGHIYSMIVML